MEVTLFRVCVMLLVQPIRVDGYVCLWVMGEKEVLTDWLLHHRILMLLFHVLSTDPL